MESNILEFWQAVETLTPQDAFRVNASDLTNPVYGIDCDQFAEFPWSSAKHLNKPLDAGLVWAYEAQCGIHETHELSELVVNALSKSPGVEEENKGGTSRTFDLRFDANGMPMPQTFSLSLSAWAAGQLLAFDGGIAALLAGGTWTANELPEPASDVNSPQSGFAAFDRLSMGIIQWVANEVAQFREASTWPSVEWLKALVELVAEVSHIPRGLFDGRAIVRIRGTRVRESKANEKGDFVDGLGSFYAADLKKIAAAVQRGDVGRGMRQFMSAGKGSESTLRVDVRDPDNNLYLGEALSPRRMPRGRWPSDHALAFSQQLAVNEIFAELENGSGLFAVNGPPGTGKTTLLRDVVASVVTRRAESLIDLGDKAFVQKAVVKIGDVAAPFYALHPKLHGHSIVVASENNGAVENVTKELPGIDAVPLRVAARMNYFPEIAKAVSGKVAWGLMAAPLGNRRNRTEFVSRFWWGDRALAGRTTAPAMREHLKSKMGESTAADELWAAAIGEFKQAVKAEKAARKRVETCSTLPGRIAALALQIQGGVASKSVLSADFAKSNHGLELMHQSLDAIRANAQAALKHHGEAKDALERHMAQKPSLIGNLVSMGKKGALWLSSTHTLQKTLNDARNLTCRLEGDAIAIEMQLAKAQIAHNILTLKLATQDRIIDQQRADCRKLECQLEDYVQELSCAWLDIEADPSDREHVVPWGDDQWLASRESVFLAALNVHRAFIEAHPTQMTANLALACDWLSGKRLPPELTTLALDSLCMVVPVVSATFASIPRMFANAQREAIGYLLIDEAGQAQSPHAACAIWRAQRTVMVGDPLQLEPVFTMHDSVESELARHFSVDEPWMPSWHSAQALADRSAKLGTMLGEEGSQLWIGSPLRLHRRCAPDMFAISNMIAYGGLMVYGGNGADDLPWPRTAWLDVKANTSEGHWVDAEGVRLQGLLSELLAAGVGSDQIAMISPFRDCAARLRRIARIYELDLGKVGTIHTAQGKEADVVIVVLGGNPKSDGAKAWASAKPNLLNVAVSRGKKRLYVIGDVDLWRKQNYFSTMASLLDVEAEATAV